MKLQAVIELAGHQHLVSEGDQLTIDKSLTEKEITTDQVLLVIKDDQVELGTPVVKGTKVNLKVLETKKGPKVITARYRAKSRYRRKIGHRQPQTLLEVTKIALV